MKPCSKEFRGQVLAACGRGRSTRALTTYFNVSESWVRRIKRDRRELNKTAPLLKRRRTPLWVDWADRMREIIQRKPELTLRELKAELQTDLSVATLCVAFKKKSSSPPSGSGPDLNPIELVFSKFKWLLKNASARTVESLWSVCGQLLDRFRETECRSCFRHSGYRYT